MLSYYEHTVAQVRRDGTVVGMRIQPRTHTKYSMGSFLCIVRSKTTRHEPLVIHRTQSYYLSFLHILLRCYKRCNCNMGRRSPQWRYNPGRSSAVATTVTSSFNFAIELGSDFFLSSHLTAPRVLSAICRVCSVSQRARTVGPWKYHPTTS